MPDRFSVKYGDCPPGSGFFVGGRGRRGGERAEKLGVVGVVDGLRLVPTPPASK